jgi:predicted DNA-binding transcriptional regulator AlpA
MRYENEPDLRSSKEVARLLGVTVECLINLRRSGEGPPFITIGSRKVAYDMRDVVSWLEAKKSTGAPPPIETAAA